MKLEERNGQMLDSDFIDKVQGWGRFIREDDSPDDMISMAVAGEILLLCPPEGKEWDEVEEWIRIAVATEWVDIMSTPLESDFREWNSWLNVEQLGKSAANCMMMTAKDTEGGLENMEISYQRAWAVLYYGRLAWDYLEKKRLVELFSALRKGEQPPAPSY